MDESFQTVANGLKGHAGSKNIQKRHLVDVVSLKRMHNANCAMWFVVMGSLRVVGSTRTELDSLCKVTVSLQESDSLRDSSLSMTLLHRLGGYVFLSKRQAQNAWLSADRLSPHL